MKISTFLLAAFVTLACTLPTSTANAQIPDRSFRNPPIGMSGPGKRTTPTLLWGFGPTFINSGSELDGIYYPDFKPFASWSNDLGVMLRTRLGGDMSKVNLTYGLLWRYINVETDKGVLGIDGNDPFYFRDPEATNTELNIHTLSIPLMIEYRSKFSVAAGGFLAYRIGSNSEHDYKVDGNRFRTKLYADFGLNDLLYGASLQIGGKRARLYMNYYLNTLFAKDEPYNFTVMNVGIVLI
jgi:hypothetical protein